MPIILLHLLIEFGILMVIHLHKLVQPLLLFVQPFIILPLLFGGTLEVDILTILNIAVLHILLLVFSAFPPMDLFTGKPAGLSFLLTPVPMVVR
jgi:hypothetical protein